MPQRETAEEQGQDPAAEGDGDSPNEKTSHLSKEELETERQRLDEELEQAMATARMYRYRLELAYPTVVL